MTNEEYLLIKNGIMGYVDQSNTAVKTYIDFGDSKVLADAKAYVDGLVGAGTDLTAITNAINLIRDALDGDASQPGMQLLNSLIAQVNDHKARLDALELATTQHTAAIQGLGQSVTDNKAAIENALAEETRLRSEADMAFGNRIQSTENGIAGVQQSISQFVTGAQVMDIFSGLRDLAIAKFATPAP